MREIPASADGLQQETEELLNVFHEVVGWRVRDTPRREAQVNRDKKPRLAWDGEDWFRLSDDRPAIQTWGHNVKGFLPVRQSRGSHERRAVGGADKVGESGEPRKSKKTQESLCSPTVGPASILGSFLAVFRPDRPSIDGPTAPGGYHSVPIPRGYFRGGRAPTQLSPSAGRRGTNTASTLSPRIRARTRAHRRPRRARGVPRHT